MEITNSYIRGNAVGTLDSTLNPHFYSQFSTTMPLPSADIHFFSHTLPSSLLNQQILLPPAKST
jgi:hypothetical protein